MKTRLVHLFEQLRSTFWVLPAAAVVLAMAGAFLLVWFDHAQSEWILSLAPWLEHVSAEGTTTLLGTVASSVLTLAGVTFSVTLVALTLASSQFGPRLLRNFIRSNTTQLTLGVLLATHVYCLVVMRNVRVGELAFVPHAATLGAFLLSLLSVGLFIVFIHHVVVSIQAERVVADVYGELCRAVDRFFGEEGRADDEEEAEREREKEEWDDLSREEALTAERAGYVQAVDIPGLVSLAVRHDLHCRVLVTPGNFVVRGEPLLAWNVTGGLDERARGEFGERFLIGLQRTAEQDFEYCIRQLVEIALRALSPGINDPFTANNCIDYLGGALARVAGKRLPQDEFCDGEGVARVQTRPETFASFLEAACNQIRQAAVDKPDVSIRLLEMLRSVGEQCVVRPQLEAVLRQGEMVATVAMDRAVTEQDREAIGGRYEDLRGLAKDS